jgi:hypothetical protein
VMRMAATTKPPLREGSVSTCSRKLCGSSGIP